MQQLCRLGHFLIVGSLFFLRVVKKRQMVDMDKIVLDILLQRTVGFDHKPAFGIFLEQRAVQKIQARGIAKIALGQPHRPHILKIGVLVAAVGFGYDFVQFLVDLVLPILLVVRKTEGAAQRENGGIGGDMFLHQTVKLRLHFDGIATAGLLHRIVVALYETIKLVVKDLLISHRTYHLGFIDCGFLLSAREKAGKQKTNCHRGAKDAKQSGSFHGDTSFRMVYQFLIIHQFYVDCVNKRRFEAVLEKNLEIPKKLFHFYQIYDIMKKGKHTLFKGGFYAFSTQYFSDDGD